MNAGAPDSLSPDVCLIKMIHCYAAWFCQGGLVRTLLQALWLAGLWVTWSCWESWDVRHDSEESCTWSTMMFCTEVMGTVSGCTVGETFAPFYRWAKKWVKCLAVTAGGEVCHCNRGCLCATHTMCVCSFSLISMLPGRSAPVCPPPPTSTS